uniref:Uncharacterized protein n=1 Tax=Strongyloides papillosus TaxID=174720 RepID=A0A0N5B9B6_STREA
MAEGEQRNSEMMIEILRNIRDSISVIIHELNKVKKSLEASEKKYILHIKKVKNTNHKDCILNMVKILAVSRHFFEKIRMIKAILRSVSLESSSWIRRMSSNHTMRPSAIAIKKMQKKINIAQKHIPSINFLNVFSMMETKEEITSDKIDNIFEGFEDYEELESILEKFLVDLGIKVEA